MIYVNTTMTVEEGESARTFNCVGVSFGEGTVLCGAGVGGDGQNGYATYLNHPDPKPVGSAYPASNLFHGDPELIFRFSTIESLDVVIGQLQKLRKMMKTYKEKHGGLV